jgi:MYXO-CTERM domain-containing protein
VAFIALTAGLTTGFADAIPEPTAALPPIDGSYSLDPLCITPVCLADIGISGFQITGDTISGGNELVQTTAVFSAEVLQNNLGSPGAPIGFVSLQGTVDFTWFNRTDPDQTGTFTGQITGFDFAGQFNGNSFEFMQNPNEASTGSATVTEKIGNSQTIIWSPKVPFITSSLPTSFQVTSFFDIFAELSLNGGPFVPGPDRDASLVSATPEPGSAGLALLSLLGVGGMALRRRSAQR